MKKILKTIEKRNSSLSGIITNEDDNEMRLSGHAAVFNQPTVIFESAGVEFKEVIDRNAFDECDISACCLKYNHSDHIPILSRVRSGNLKITTDSIGLKFETTLFETQTSRDVYSLIKQGGLDSCSFAFTIQEESYNSETHTRTILKIDKLFDVSIVDFPAYEGTDVSARSYFEAEAEKLKALESLQKLNRKKNILKLKLHK